MITRVNRAKEGFADYLISGARKDSIYTRDQKDKTITLYGNLQTFKQTEKYLNKYKNYEVWGRHAGNKIKNRRK